MKIIRKQEPVVAPMPRTEERSPDKSVEVLAALAEATNVMLGEVAQSTVRVAEAVARDPKPASYRCTVTSRDEDGRILTFEVRPI